ncbi:MAG: MgtC/SapB family protein [Bacteroidaceae bacterium]|nr:MgtC/SapB family protein [Bacteroidaceae bacterium]
MTVSYLLDLINSTEVNIVGAVFKLVLSGLLGAMIGIERKHKGQRAGMRTIALISMGATLAMLVSIYIPQVYMGLKNGDPGRIAAQVVSGIGFLGAGAIIQSKGSVRGLTTAAVIWITAMVGLAVGSGMYLVASLTTVMILIVLTILDKYEKQLRMNWESKIIRIKLGAEQAEINPYNVLFDKYGVHVSDTYIRYEYTQPTTTLNFMIRTKGDTDFIKLFEEIRGVSDKTVSITLTDEVNN